VTVIGSMSLQTPTMIRVLQRELCREAKKRARAAQMTLAVRALFRVPDGEPDAGNPHVRFDERGWETERCRMAQATAPILDSATAAVGGCPLFDRSRG
jgi:hypothetical protein